MRGLNLVYSSLLQMTQSVARFEKCTLIESLKRAWGADILCENLQRSIDKTFQLRLVAMQSWRHESCNDLGMCPVLFQPSRRKDWELLFTVVKSKHIRFLEKADDYRGPQTKWICVSIHYQSSAKIASTLIHPTLDTQHLSRTWAPHRRPSYSTVG